MPSPIDLDLAVQGTVPADVSGQLVATGGDGTLHSFQIGPDHVSYRACDFGTDALVQDLFRFGDSIFAVRDGSLACELASDLTSLRPVDLAGRGRALATSPKYDTTTGELHLLARESDGSLSHVIVSAGALTRRTNPVAGPCAITDFVRSADHVALSADGFAGLALRGIPTEAAADGGWVLRFVDDPADENVELRVIGGTAAAAPAVATVRIPCHLPRALRCAWLPAVQH